MIRDTTIQRPQLFYGATKVFGEHMGLFYRRKYQLDFRGLRYPSIIGPGVRTPGVAQYTSWVIEECAKGNPFTIWVKPETSSTGDVYQRRRTGDGAIGRRAGGADQNRHLSH